MPDIDITQRAADYVAGELDQTQRLAFEQCLAKDIKLQQEVAYWRSLLPALDLDGRPPAQVPDLTQRVRQCLAPTAQPISTKPAPPASAPKPTLRLLPSLLAAAACLLLAIDIGMRLGAKETGPMPAYTEGRNNLSAEDFNRLVSMRSDQPLRERPCLGIDFIPVQAPLDPPMSGLGIERLIRGGAADQAGLLPGDIILTIDGKTICSQDCLCSVMTRETPNKVVWVGYWRQGQNAIQNRQVTLGSYREIDHQGRLGSDIQ